MEKTFRCNAFIVGFLFISTMALGMVDAYDVLPKLAASSANLNQLHSTLLLGIFSVFFMAIGIVGIAICLFPVVRKSHEKIALTYLSFRILEAVLLMVGALIYLFFLSSAQAESDFINLGLVKTFLKIKFSAYQLAMLALGIGSSLLCYSFYQSRSIPRWISLWGLIGYLLLLSSAALDLLGLVDTINGVGALLYVPGGLWELLIFPIWLFVKGFEVETSTSK